MSSFSNAARVWEQWPNRPIAPSLTTCHPQPADEGGLPCSRVDCSGRLGSRSRSPCCCCCSVCCRAGDAERCARNTRTRSARVVRAPFRRARPSESRSRSGAPRGRSEHQPACQHAVQQRRGARREAQPCRAYALLESHATDGASPRGTDCTCRSNRAWRDRAANARAVEGTEHSAGEHREEEDEVEADTGSRLELLVFLSTVPQSMAPSFSAHASSRSSAPVFATSH
jgi:hypothetical protein